MRTILTILSFTIFAFQLLGQTPELKRKASLGVMLETVNDSMSTANGLDSNKGLFIGSVLENSTASRMGLRQGDIITELNNAPISSIQEILAEIGKYREGEKLTATVYRNGRQVTATGMARARPKEQSDLAEVEYGVVEYPGNRLRSILHLPKNKIKPPTVFFIQGYPCQSVDLAFLPQHPTRKLIDDWVQAGFAVYRIEKPGMGDSQSQKDCFELNFSEELEAFKNGYLDLIQNPKIDSDNIFLFGHSIGGIIAPVIASEFQPKGVITYGTVVNTWFEYMQELTRVQGVYFNEPDSVIEEDIRNATPFWYEMLVSQKSIDEILENAEIYRLLEEEGTLESFKSGQFIQRHHTYWTGIQNLYLTRIWAKVQSKVLALYGEFDIQALNADHIYAIERIVNRHFKGNAQAQVIEGADHGFVGFHSMSENIQTLNSGQYGNYLREHYHAGIAQTTINWMKLYLE